MADRYKPPNYGRGVGNPILAIGTKDFLTKFFGFSQAFYMKLLYTNKCVLMKDTASHPGSLIKLRTDITILFYILSIYLLFPSSPSLS